MGSIETDQFLPHLASEKHVVASTHNRQIPHQLKLSLRKNTMNEKAIIKSKETRLIKITSGFCTEKSDQEYIFRNL